MKNPVEEKRNIPQNATANQAKQKTNAPMDSEDGFQMIFKEPRRLALFIISVVLAVGLIIGGSILLSAPRKSEKKIKSLETTGTFYSTGSKTVSATGEYKYYEFTPSGSSLYTIYTTSTGRYDVEGTILDSNYNTIETDDDGGTNGNFMIQRYLYAGEKYYIGVRLYSGTGTVTLHIE